jgi:hypothetical protein
MRGAVRTEPVRGSRNMKAALWVCALAAPCIAMRNMPPALAQIEEYVPGAWHSGRWRVSTRR